MGKRVILALVMVLAVGCNDKDGDGGGNPLSPAGGGGLPNVSANGASMANADGLCSDGFEQAMTNMSNFAVSVQEQLTNLEQQMESGAVSPEQAESIAMQALENLDAACDQLTSEWGTGTCTAIGSNGQPFEVGTEMICGWN